MLIKLTTGLVNDSFELCRKFYKTFLELVEKTKVPYDFMSFKMEELSIEISGRSKWEYLFSVDPLDVARIKMLRRKKNETKKEEERKKEKNERTKKGKENKKGKEKQKKEKKK